jgi:adenine phosphoribosyltransferase
MAYLLGSRIVLARRPPKLPRAAEAISYSMVYSPHKEIGIHRDAIEKHRGVLVVDDFLASGGTLKAILALLERVEARVLGASFVVEVLDMKARQDPTLTGLLIHCLLRMEFDQVRKLWRITDSEI